jgi:protocatechuate 3,4-dioxygenase beta subunit
MRLPSSGPRSHLSPPVSYPLVTPFPYAGAMTRIESPDDFAATDPVEVAITRRRLLIASGLAGGAVLLGGGAFAATSTKKSNGKSCAVIPRETGGPFPGDGSNGINVLTQKGIVRRDIRSSFGSSTTASPGVPLSVTFSLRSSGKSCGPLAGAALYAWHCDVDGNYSLYSPGVENENFLRGVQVSDAKGNLTFQTIFPGAYPGRWPHIHFEIFSSAGKATTSRNAIATSQLAFDKTSCLAAYGASGYEASLAEVEGREISQDGVFRDGAQLQTAKTVGDLSKGFSSTLIVNV